MSEQRIYFTIRALTSSAPTEQQWRDLFHDMAQQTGTLARGVLQAARSAENLLSAHKRSQNPAQLRRYTLCGLEIEDGDRGNLLVLLDAVAAARTITGNRQAKFEGVMQVEAREAAVRLGFSVAQANTITCVVVGLGSRETAMNAVQNYLAANPAIWYDAGS